MSLTEVLVPAEAQQAEESVVVTWLKQVGDAVEAGDVLVILQVEKVAFEVVAPASGLLTAVLAEQGEVVKKGHPLAMIEAADEVGVAPSEPLQPARTPERPPAGTAGEVRASPVAKRLARDHNVELGRLVGTGAGGRITEKDVRAVIDARSTEAEASVPSVPGAAVRASPIARRMAREHGIDLARVEGSGRDSRIVEQDIQALIDARQSPPMAEGDEAAIQTLLMAGMRGTIARRMHQSLQEMAQLTLHTEADVTELVALRETLKVDSPVTYTDLIVKACALALERHPRLNATLEGDTIRLLPYIHIGVAVALDEGLIVPVLPDPLHKSLAEIAGERVRLVERAHANQLTTPEISGSTFTITNLGTFEIDGFTPIVNPPETAVLGVGRIVDKVVIHQGKVAQRAMMTLSLSFDHRLVDGAPAAAFLRTIKHTLEQPAALAYLKR